MAELAKHGATSAAPGSVQGVAASEPRLGGAAWIVLALAVLARLVWACLVPVVPVSDCEAYDIFARNLAAGGAFGFAPDEPSLFWPPGTSFLYSLVYRISAPEQLGFALATALNLACGVGLVALSMHLAREWFGRRAALACGLLLALWPMHVQFTTLIASELAFTLACLLALRAWRRRSSPVRAALLTGLCLAAATYIRPTALLLPAVFALVDVLRDRKLVAPLLRAAGALLVILACVLPWSLRNQRHFGRFVLVSANGGSNLWMGNNPQTTGYYQPLPELGLTNQAEIDEELARRAKEYIRAEPAAFVVRTLKKAVLLHRSETIGVVWNEPGLQRAAPSLFGGAARGVKLLKLASTAYWWLALALALFGWVRLARSSGAWAALTHPATALWAYFVVVHAVIVIQDRYHFPATPLIAALAGLGLARAQRDEPVARVYRDDPMARAQRDDGSS
jgi:4-amino-4-deoxy-L-arabinose transferase-like glycosyltransferase